MPKRPANQSKPKRGRPPAFPKNYLRPLAARHPQIKTRRGLLNVAYRIRAMQILGNDLAFSWLCDRRSGVCRLSLLTERPRKCSGGAW
jgi:hypothetical protein